ncbi:MAG: thioesterase family protein [Lapillicoccus sp.]
MVAAPAPSPSVDGCPYAARVPTRWNDNDVYGHVNNTVHYLAMDTVVNAWLIDHGLDVERGKQIGLVVESGCRYLAPVTYPDALVLGLRISRLGSSSVRWEIAMDRESDGARVAEGHFVHVFVDRQSRRPAPVPPELRAAMGALVIDDGPAEGQDGSGSEI